MAFKFVAGDGRAPLKMWCEGVQVEDAAMRQLENVAGLPFIYKHVAAMPDVHWGMGATVGICRSGIGSIFGDVGVADSA